MQTVATLAVLLTSLIACVRGGQEPYVMQREAMVREQIEARGVKDPRVLAALRRVARDRFVLSGSEAVAYQDSPLSIGHGQTISQPYIVAVMSEAAAIGPDDEVLEIGTGSAYQTAVLAELARTVYTIEIIPELATRAEALLRALGYGNVRTRLGDGYAGWPEHAPFHAIVVTAAPPDVPEALKQQLAVGGRMVVPVGTGDQELLVIERTADRFTQRRLMPVRFVPMVKGKL
ncbi:Protein-L-isoaspartate O-methyltransferase [Luteitalea pratensis]|uniref:Protein-L-isoaspartate O-methyltransferase n=1 Tax=Luteitalea pratensis TaxID=1855912 RepID=A0A143PPG3_LUTPR|nr:protein-L-isoaspartate(D-aspartate) O-methyltransferase [Luteitalea pratensis]AMY10465.1 Protein-L-isoaspartate O-methyltransferase [Luteitalea pratensis]